MKTGRGIILFVLAATVLLVLYFSFRGREPVSDDVAGQAQIPMGEPHAPGALLAGRAAYGASHDDSPGIRRHFTPADLPAPYATTSVSNPPRMVGRPPDGWPVAPPGFTVQLFASGLTEPRKLAAAPNGDIFVAESLSGTIRVLRGPGAAGPRQQMEVFASGLDRPYGIAFYPPGRSPRYVYVANTGSVIRFAYQNGDLKARAAPEIVVADLPGSGLIPGGHWTRDLAFSRDGSSMYVSVGSYSNVSDNFLEKRRAAILEFTPRGENERIYASGIRNPSGLAIHPATGELWASVNERDGLGDNLVPDYVTRVTPGGFYGWPWYYIGNHQDPRHQGKHPELRNKILIPDVLLQAHSASLGITFYDGAQFPQQYRGDGFAAEHGSWNRSARTGYKVIRIRARNGVPTGEYEDFLTGFVLSDGRVWGRPAGVAVAQDGSLLVSDDTSGSVWRVRYTAGSRAAAAAQ